jgi:hypothetical protein
MVAAEKKSIDDAVIDETIALAVASGKRISQ